ncbi:hypothetical protein G9C98_006302 [Cotesia typhae]|uniref:Uncharacterized protein n=1 Tax=Cotesia typhae TaxID=2053667 RepID=A0A8J5QXE7_9HYME|nr:hypothetical protein G9C98_006302 [Cotesia typhae]
MVKCPIQKIQARDRLKTESVQRIVWICCIRRREVASRVESRRASGQSLARTVAPTAPSVSMTSESLPDTRFSFSIQRIWPRTIGC